MTSMLLLNMKQNLMNNSRCLCLLYVFRYSENVAIVRHRFFENECVMEMIYRSRYPERNLTESPHCIRKRCLPKLFIFLRYLCVIVSILFCLKY